MAKLHTPRKSEADCYAKISSWTKKNLAALQASSPIPVIVKLANGNYKVATFNVVRREHVWVADDKEFFDKRSAIFYCALKHMNNMMEANALLDADRNVKMLDFDKVMFRRRLDRAHLTGDEFKIGLYSSRYETAKQAFKVAKSELELVITRQFRRLNINNSNTSF